MIPGPVPNGERLRVAGTPAVRPCLGPAARSWCADGASRRAQRRRPVRQALATGGSDGDGRFEGFKHAAFPLVAFQDRGISDSFAALICHGVLERFPNLRLASIENGAMWVPTLLRTLRDGYGKMPFAFKEHPVEQFKRQVWVAPYYEDDMEMLKHELGIDRLLFGSDFPHAEGLPEPTDFVKDIPTYTDDEIRAVMRDNVLELLTPKPA